MSWQSGKKRRNMKMTGRGIKREKKMALIMTAHQVIRGIGTKMTEDTGKDIILRTEMIMRELKGNTEMMIMKELEMRNTETVTTVMIIRKVELNMMIGEMVIIGGKMV